MVLSIQRITVEVPPALQKYLLPCFMNLMPDHVPSAHRNHVHYIALERIWVFFSNQSTYSHQDLARIYEISTLSTRSLVHRFVTARGSLFGGFVQKYEVNCLECDSDDFPAAIKGILNQIWRGFDWVQLQLGDVWYTDL